MKILLTLVLFLATNAAAFDVVGSLPQGLGDGRYVQKAGDTVTGPLTLSASTLTVMGNAFSVGGSTLVVSGGKVGVGVASPLSSFVVAKQITEHPDSNKYGQIEATLTDPAYRMSMGYDATLNGGFLQAIINESAYRPIAINPRGGNVGIGTSAPSQKLQISSGTIHIDGSGSPTVGGALCLNATGNMSKCTTAVDASGNCTCP